jgi:hypothetical protein
MVLKTVNRFSKLNSSSLHARLISDCQNPAIVGRRNTGGIEIRQHPATEILPTPKSDDIPPPSLDAGESDSDRNWPEFGHGQKLTRSGQNGRDPTGFGWIWPLILPDLDEFGHGSGRIWPKWPGSGRNLAILAESGQTCSPKFDNGDRTLPDSSDSCIFTFRNFFVQTKRRKIFSKKIFFLKMIS